MFNGLFITAGTRIGYCTFDTMGKKAVWCEDTNAFRPEWWLEGTPDKIREQEATLDLGFGYGRWQCLGKNVAHMELNKVEWSHF